MIIWTILGNQILLPRWRYITHKPSAKNVLFKRIHLSESAKIFVVKIKVEMTWGLIRISEIRFIKTNQTSPPQGIRCFNRNKISSPKIEILSVASWSRAWAFFHNLTPSCWEIKLSKLESQSIRESTTSTLTRTEDITLIWSTRSQETPPKVSFMKTWNRFRKLNRRGWIELNSQN
jgi:hypothetical protein